MKLNEVLSRIDARIAELGTTDRAISVKAGMSPDGIRNWRRRAASDNASGANANSVMLVAQALGVSENWLLNGDGPPPAGFADPAAEFEHASTDTVIADPDPGPMLFQHLAPSARHPALFTAAQALLSFGIFGGDKLVADLKSAARPGDLVLATQADLETGAARTFIRRYLPPYLISGDPMSHEDVMVVDNASISILASVVAVYRTAKPEA